MNKEETLIDDCVSYIANDVWKKDVLTYKEQDEYKEYLNTIIKEFTKEKDKKIEKLNNIIDETLKELEKIGDFYTTPAGEVIHLKDKILHINKAINKLKEGKQCMI